MPILCQPVAQPGALTDSIGGSVTVVDTIESVDRVLAADPHENLVVIGHGIDLDLALAFASTLRVRRPAVGVVLIREQIDVAVLTRALQSGIREVVPAGLLTELGQACDRSRVLSRTVAAVGAEDAPHEGQVITVFSAKGGCGKTTLAVNLACALAEAGAGSVCLVDLDLAFGDVAINLQLDPTHTIVDAVPMSGRMDETGARSLLTPYRPGLDVLLAPVTPGDAERVPPALVTELIAVLRGMVDYVVIDTPSQFSEHVLNAMDASQQLVLLTTPDVPALKNLRLTLDMLDLLSYPRDTRSVVLNRSDSKVGLTADDIERVVRGPVAAHVPSSREVPISINRGTPIVVGSPGHPVSSAIMRFARSNVIVDQRPSAVGSAPGPDVAAAVRSELRKPGAFARLRKGRR